MNVALWILQGILVFAMFGAGSLKLAAPHAKLAEKMKWAATWPPARVKLLGLAQVLGAVGLVAPLAASSHLSSNLSLTTNFFPCKTL